MPVFKVMNCDRSVKKLVLATSLSDLKEKAKGKLGINDVEQFLLEEDGIEVDEDEILLALPLTTVLMALGHGETWSPAKVEETNISPANIPPAIVHPAIIHPAIIPTDTSHANTKKPDTSVLETRESSLLPDAISYVNNNTDKIKCFIKRHEIENPLPRAGDMGKPQDPSGRISEDIPDETLDGLTNFIVGQFSELRDLSHGDNASLVYDTMKFVFDNIQKKDDNELINTRKDTIIAPPVARLDSSTFASPGTMGFSLTRRNSVTFSTPLPTFSDYVQQKMLEGQATTVWTKMINQAAEYYLEKFPSMTSAEYQIVGEKMVRMFPSVHQIGNNPWSVFCKDLSQRVRYVRWSRKKKSADEDHPQGPPKKIFRTEKNAKETISPESSADDYEKNVDELKKESEKRTPNDKTVKALLTETQDRRMEWIKSLPDGQVKPILDKFPVFQDGQYIIYAFGRMLGKQEVSLMIDRLVSLQEVIEKMIGKSSSGDLRFLPVVEFLEKETAFSKGKGVKSKSVIVKKKNIDDENKDDESKTKSGEPPHLVVFINEDERHTKLEEISCVMDGIMIYSHARTLADSVLLLIAVYYIFDLQYPRQYSQLLGLVQEYIVNEPFTGEKSKKYKLLATKLNKTFRK